MHSYPPHNPQPSYARSTDTTAYRYTESPTPMANVYDYHEHDYDSPQTYVHRGDRHAKPHAEFERRFHATEDQRSSSRDRHRESAYTRLSATNTAHHHTQPQPTHHVHGRHSEHHDVHAHQDHRGRSSWPEKQSGYDRHTPRTEKQSRYSDPEHYTEQPHSAQRGHRQRPRSVRFLTEEGFSTPGDDDEAKPSHHEHRSDSPGRRRRHSHGHDNGQHGYAPHSQPRHSYVRDHFPAFPPSHSPQSQSSIPSAPHGGYTHPRTQEPRRPVTDREIAEFSDFNANEVPFLPPNQKHSRRQSPKSNAYEHEHDHNDQRDYDHGHDHGHSHVHHHDSFASDTLNGGYSYDGHSHTREENNANATQPTIHQPQPIDMTMLSHLLPLLQNSQKKPKKSFAKRLKKAFSDFVAEPELPEPPSPPPGIRRHQMYMLERARLNAQKMVKKDADYNKVQVADYHPLGLDPA